MSGAERVVNALLAIGEAGQAARRAQGADARAPAGQDLVGIDLMSDVPDQAIGRSVEDIMQGHGEFDDAKARAKMAPGDGNRPDGFFAQFVRDPG